MNDTAKATPAARTPPSGEMIAMAVMLAESSRLDLIRMRLRAAAVWVMMNSTACPTPSRNVCERGSPAWRATETRAVIDRYFDLMGRGEDFAPCYAADARWTTFDSGTVVSGPTEIRDYLIGLHRNMPDIQTRPLAYAAETAYVEGDCADPRRTDTPSNSVLHRLRHRQWRYHVCTLLWGDRIPRAGRRQRSGRGA